MTPKEKAENLIYMFNRQSSSNKDYNHISYTQQEKENYANKNNAILCVRYILKAVDNPDETYLMKDFVNYWSQVKKELEAL
jgi:hypothetical protein